MSAERRYWFKRGAGGTIGRPASWEGWALAAAFVVGIALIPDNAARWYYGGAEASILGRVLVGLLSTAPVAIVFFVLAKANLEPDRERSP